MRIGNAWSNLRPVINDNFTFYQIKELAGLAGLPIFQLHEFTQKLGGTSKGQLLDAIDGLFSDLNQDDQDRTTIHLIEQILKRKPELQSILSHFLVKLGWTISDNEIQPLTLNIDIEITDLPDAIQKGFKICLQRYRDGDVAGAITSICGIIDSITEDIYKMNALGDHKDAKYHERVSKSIRTFEHSFKLKLSIEDMLEEEIIQLWDNYSKAIKSAGFVLASFRRNFSDTHGIKGASPEFLQISINSAIFILRSLLAKRFEIDKEHPYHQISVELGQFIKNCIVLPIGRKVILNSPAEINDIFRKISFTRPDHIKLLQNGIIDGNSNITLKGIEICKAISFLE